jgi:mannosidase alpha-like ER degradation enhancer 1
VLGGLLSGHLIAVDPIWRMNLTQYDGGLLRLAVDLGDRLMYAFQGVSHGIPRSYVRKQACA